jgi:CheY-like chemotaxis protein
MAGKTILVIEDDDITRTGFGVVLRGSGYQAGLAANGKEALDHIQKSGLPDLIVLDMLLPGIDGWKVLKHRDVLWPSVKVLIVTALPVASDEWASSLGAAGCLRKPVDLKELLEKVETILGADGGLRE